MKLLPSLGLFLAAASFALPVQAQFIIESSSAIFAPSFRDATNTDFGNTTWWGWSPGSFDQTIDNELIDSPPVTLGIGGLDGTLNQASTNDILASSNNIYTGTFVAEALNFSIPTNGTVGSGFTTIIVQGRTAFGGWNVTPGGFSDIAGISPSVVFGNNALSRGQFWAKYEIPNNAASYALTLTVPDFTSIAEITVDTQWSPTSFALDTAVVPEPSSALLMLIGSAGLIALRARRKKAHSA